MAIVVNVIGNYNGRAINDATRDLQKMRKQAGYAASDIQGKFAIVGKSLERTGANLTRNLTLPIVGIGTASVLAYNKVDDALDKVASTTGATGGRLAGLQNSFRVVADTATQDLETVGAAVGAVNTRLGLTGKPLETVTTKFLDLARVTGEETAPMIAEVTRAMNDAGVKGKGAGKFMDSLLVASQKTGIGVTQLSGLLYKFGSPLRQLGFSTDQQIATLAAFDKAGVNTKLVMGSMRIALGSLAKKGEKDLPAALGKGIKAIKNAKTGGEAAAKAIKLFGSRAGPDMAAAIREGRLSVDDLQNALKKSTGALDKTKGATDGFKENLDRMKNKVTLAGASLGEELLPYLEKLLGYAEKAITWFKGLDSGTQSLIVKFGLFAAALGPVVSVVGKVSRGISGTIGAMKAVKDGLAATGRTIKGAAQGLGRLRDGYRNASSAQSAFSGKLGTLGGKLRNVRDGVAGIGGKLSNLGSAMKTAAINAGKFTVELIKQTGAMIKNAAASAGQAIKTGILTVAQGVAKAATATWTAIQWLLNAAMTANPIGLIVLAIVGLVAVLVIAYKKSETFRNIVKGAFAKVLTAVKAVWNWIKSNWPLLLAILAGPIGLIVLFMVKNWKKIKDTISTAWTNIKTAVSDGIGKVVEFVKGMPTKVLNSLKNFGSLLYNTGKDLIQGLLDGAGSLLSKIGSFFLDKLPAWIREPFKKALGIASPSKVFYGYGENLMDGLMNAIKNKKANVADSMKKVAEAIKDATTAALDKVKEKYRTALDYARDVSSQMRDFGAVTGFQAQDGKATTATDIIGDMRSRLAKVQEFGTVLKQLAKLGLNKASMAQIISAGPTSGLEIGQALLAQGASAIGEVNSLQKQLGVSAYGIGDTASTSQFGVTQAQAKGVINTTVKVERGGVVINFGSGVKASDRAAISAAVDTAVDKALKRVTREIARS